LQTSEICAAPLKSRSIKQKRDLLCQAKMKSVVMIAYAFPPEGNAGAYRPLRFVRHLPVLDWQPTIVTVKTDFYERYDPSLLSQVPKEIEVIRVRNPDLWQALLAKRSQRVKTQLSEASPVEAARILRSHQKPTRSRLRELVRSFEARVYHPDIAMGWIRPAVKTTLKICALKRPDMIWATAGPVSSFIVAQHTSHKTGIPYVLDFRDAWTLSFNEFEARQPRWAQRLAYRSMYRSLKDARAVVFRYTTEAECFWRAYPRALDVARVHIIPNGFDGDVEPYQTPAVTDKCRILYTGTLGDYRFDTLLQGLRTFKDESPQLADCLQLHVVGEDNHKLGELAATLDLRGMIRTIGTVGFDEVTQMSRDAHALLVLGRYPTMRGYELFAPAKLFSYLKMGRPIIGVLPEDEAKKILSQVGVTTVADVDSLPEIVTVLRHLLQTWKAGQLASLVPIVDSCRDFSASHQTRLLVTALAGKVADTPFVPGRQTIPPSLRDEIKRRTMEGERLGHQTLRQGLAAH
jgi:glycosyltransferase involved in cell wall biosynthesis